MSGHNPQHGRLGQQSNASTYNHLQVPYIPRQPQLAHVHMNDSILRSSPLNWHHQSDAAFLNYMSTQHKTPLDLNPLAFVRPPVANSFGTVDLSFPSHHRHNLTPSPHNISVTPPLQLSSKSMSNSSTALPSPNGLKEVMNAIVNGNDKIAANGNEKLGICDPLASSSSHSTTGSFMGHQLNDATKNTGWNTSTSGHNEPIELIKEKILKLIERNATTPTDTATASLINHLPIASTIASLPPNSATNNNNSGAQQRSVGDSLNTSRDSQMTTSNDDSVDSINASGNRKQRRRRKPNKTCRLANNGNVNDDDDDADEVEKKNGIVPSNNGKASVNENTSPSKLIDRPQENGSNGKAKEAVSTAAPNVSSEVPLQLPTQAECSDNGATRSATATDGFCTPVATRNRRSTSQITSPSDMSQDNSNSSPNQRRPGKRKCEAATSSSSSAAADADCETIDKIAAMIASSSPEFNPQNGRSTPKLIPNAPVSSEPLSARPENGNSKDSSDKAPVPEPSQPASTAVDQPKDRRFEDVEIKLEEMFAGIEDDVDQKKANSTKLDGCKEVRVAIESLGSLDPSSIAVTRTDNNKKTKTKPEKKMMNVSTTSEDTDYKPAKKPTKRLPKTKTKRGKGKKTLNNKTGKGNAQANTTDNKKTKIKEEALDTTATTTTKFRGPFIHVRLDGSSNVVNAPITEEIAENKSKAKKTLTSHLQTHSDRSKVRGLHVSTLSMKYDASTTDKSWMCVFCKMGPHKFGLGDLFGPYILSTESEDFALSQVDPADDAFKSKRTKSSAVQRRTLPSNAVGVTAVTTGNKRKRKVITEPIPSTSANTSINSLSGDDTTQPDIFHGMTKTTDTSYEVWVHGDCAVWSSGVHLIGPRIVGLDAAVWDSTRHRCRRCQQFGAMLCCFQRGCGDVAHIPCARKNAWTLCDENFKILCDKHSVATTTTVKQT